MWVEIEPALIIGLDDPIWQSAQLIQLLGRVAAFRAMLLGADILPSVKHPVLHLQASGKVVWHSRSRSLS